MMRLIPLPASQDIDLWFLHDGRRALGVEGLELEAILVKHHHPGHVGGVPGHTAEKLAALPGETRACCTHEYTLSNPRLAQAVEPGNLQLINDSKRCEELRAQGLLGKQANPFLRTRQWKNAFR